MLVATWRPSRVLFHAMQVAFLRFPIPFRASPFQAEVVGVRIAALSLILSRLHPYLGCRGRLPPSLPVLPELHRDDLLKTLSANLTTLALAAPTLDQPLLSLSLFVVITALRLRPPPLPTILAAALDAIRSIVKSLPPGPVGESVLRCGLVSGGHRIEFQLAFCVSNVSKMRTTREHNFSGTFVELSLNFPFSFSGDAMSEHASRENACGRPQLTCHRSSRTSWCLLSERLGVGSNFGADRVFLSPGCTSLLLSST